MSDKKKIIVLVMSCNKEHFIAEENICRQTWAKGIFDGEYPNVEYFSYTGGNANPRVDKEQHHIYCAADDGLYKTFQKTEECLRLIEESGIDYDFIFRTNTSTVINVGLLDAFVNSGIDEDIVYCGELYSIGIPCPSPSFIYARGNSIILSKKLIGIIIDWAKYVKIPDLLFADDNIIGNILNTYHVLRFEPHKNFLKSYGFGWNKCLPENFDKKYAKRLDNGISTWDDEDESFEHLRNFISIQIKTYKERDKELDKMTHISSIVSPKRDNYDSELKFINDYMENPKYYLHDRKTGLDSYKWYYTEKNAQEVS